MNIRVWYSSAALLLFNGLFPPGTKKNHQEIRVIKYITNVWQTRYLLCWERGWGAVQELVSELTYWYITF